MANWKRFEKEVAKHFKGKRRIRVSYSSRIGDIAHPHYTIECKYGKQIPKYCITKTPIIVINDAGTHYLLEWNRESYEGAIISRNVKSTKFLDEAFAQAKRYNKKKYPLVCMKPPRFRGFIIAWELAIVREV